MREDCTGRPVRKKLRLQNYDYSGNGAYFITICTRNRQPLLWKEEHVGAAIGRPQNPADCLSACGKTVDAAIQEIPGHYPGVCVEKYVVMPNHVHMLLQIGADDAGRALRAPTISTLINQLKGAASKRCGESIWQKSYYDHIIRDEQDYLAVWKYIDENPLKWQEDELYTAE